MMDTAKSYKTAGAFRAALETRLLIRARESGIDLQRLRRQVAFDRFLARTFSKGPKATYPWVLKGGYAMELRTRFARTTKDIDLTLYDGTRLSKKTEERREQVRAMLQEAAAIRLDDHFEFLIGEAREELDGAPEGGSRYPVQARMDGREFARFHVDVGIGDEVFEPLDIITGENWLGFAGVKASSFPVISAEQQFAEKLHAYTLSRGERVNTRTKDLVDMLLLIREEKLEKNRVRAAIQATFERRATHRLPNDLEAPPREWEPVFDTLAKECRLEMSLTEGFEAARAFVRTLKR
ncbi:MAG: nucleotidyl transferase AbiEii/AbiGii toxin family protein [Candidatus Acidiferrales bacterium]